MLYQAVRRRWLMPGHAGPGVMFGVVIHVPQPEPNETIAGHATGAFDHGAISWQPGVFGREPQGLKYVGEPYGKQQVATVRTRGKAGDRKDRPGRQHDAAFQYQPGLVVDFVRSTGKFVPA